MSSRPWPQGWPAGSTIHPGRGPIHRGGSGLVPGSREVRSLGERGLDNRALAAWSQMLAQDLPRGEGVRVPDTPADDVVKMVPEGPDELLGVLDLDAAGVEAILVGAVERAGEAEWTRRERNHPAVLPAVAA